MNEPVLHRLNSLMQLREEVETLAESTPWVPPADWIETDTELLLVMDAPGVDPDAFEVVEEEGTLTLCGHRDTGPLEGTRLTAERPTGHFRRRLMFPVEVLPGTGQAQVRAGVLTLRFEKRHKIIDHE